MILISGCAGFIGFSLAKKLLSKNYKVLGIDNIDDYYDVELKKSRLSILLKYSSFKFKKIDITNKKKIDQIFQDNKINVVVNLAAQAGVRYSFEKPEKYLNSNIIGFFNIINTSRKYKVKNFIYASSSSVYGDGQLPSKESQNVDNPLNFYAQTKITNELIAKTYFQTYGFSSIGLRFFTVYGPWGRPDMAYFKFTNMILKKQKIKFHNQGKHKRDFTYIDDIIDGIYLIIINKKRIKKADLINIGSGKSYDLFYLIKNIEKNLNLKSKITSIPKQSGEITNTLANIQKIKKIYGYSPKFNLKDGIKKFIDWYFQYYKPNK